MLRSVKINPGQDIKLSSGTYFVESEIGSGGFGTVYKARSGDSVYALKLNRIWELFPDDREEIKKRIKLEFEISNNIHSEHIVHTYSYDEIGDNPILVMTYCPDGSLRKKIGQEIDQNELIDISIQILNGLNTLHSYEIIHRDIKPENILFKDKIALLTDFGISVNLKSRLTKPNILGHALKVFATLSYSPPEQSQKSLAFRQTGPTNDIFSFGVILYEMITRGQLPFGSVEDFEKDSKKIEQRKLQGSWNLKTLENWSPDPIFITVVERCLQPDPQTRFQNTLDIIDLLKSRKLGQQPETSIWKLVIVEGKEKGKHFSLTNLAKYLNKQVLNVGRYDEGSERINDISLSERSSTYISKHHATLECVMIGNNPAWYIRDGQWYEKNGNKGWYISRNGVLVNGQKIDQMGIQLKNNDTIKIGNIVFKVVFGE